MTSRTSFQYSRRDQFPACFFKNNDPTYGEPNSNWLIWCYGNIQLDTKYLVLDPLYDKWIGCRANGIAGFNIELVSVDGFHRSVISPIGYITIDLPGSNVTINYQFPWYVKGGHLYGKQADFTLRLTWNGHKIEEQHAHFDRKRDMRVGLIKQYWEQEHARWRAFYEDYYKERAGRTQ